MTIAETVREAQETLAGFREPELYADSRDFRDFVARMDPNQDEPVQYPKSLGELCIEVAQEKILSPDIRVTSNGNWTYTMTTLGVFNNTIRCEILALRTAIYHRSR